MMNNTYYLGTYALKIIFTAGHLQFARTTGCPGANIYVSITKPKSHTSKGAKRAVVKWCQNENKIDA